MFKLAIFGGSEIRDFLSSITLFDVSIPYANKNGEIDSDDIDITEELIDKENIECLQSSQDQLKKLIVGGASCGFECITNYKGESVIVIIGGGWKGVMEKSVCLFNTQTKEMVLRENVEYKYKIMCCFICVFYGYLLFIIYCLLFVIFFLCVCLFFLYYRFYHLNVVIDHQQHHTMIL